MKFVVKCAEIEVQKNRILHIKLAAIVHIFVYHSTYNTHRYKFADFSQQGYPSGRLQGRIADSSEYFVNTCTSKTGSGCNNWIRPPTNTCARRYYLTLPTRARKQVDLLVWSGWDSSDLALLITVTARLREVRLGYSCRISRTNVKSKKGEIWKYKIK